MPIEGTPFLGLNFADKTLDGATEWVRERMGQGGFQYVVTPNVDHRVRLDRLAGTPIGDELWTAYHQAGLCLNDSRVLARLARVFGKTLAVVPGSDLTAFLLQNADIPIAIIGSDEVAIADLTARYDLCDVAHHCPPMGLLNNEVAMAAAITFLQSAGHRLFFLAVGSPQSENLCLRASQAGGCTGVALCIGASIDFLTGRQARAPHWMQRAGLEWAHRLFSEPRRLWRRYLVEGPRIFWIALRDENSNMPSN
jgi:N-acetylglucosaminyldiphosphoundecaprenol N-acetyl-beta-D-mannosaminyltransferase